MQLPNEGTHTGALNGALELKEAATGSVGLEIPVKLTESEIVWSGRAYIWLINKTGEPMARGIQSVREIFGADGSMESIIKLCDSEPDPELRFSLVCEHEEYTPEGSEQPVTVFKVKFINPLGGSSSMQAANRKDVLAKYGSKFRALAGGAKVETKKATPATETKKVETKAEPTPELPKTEEKKAGGPPAAKAKTPPATKATTATAGGQPPTATMDEAWAACEAKHPQASEEQRADIWFAAIEEVAPGKANSDLSIQQWGLVRLKFA